MYWYGRGKVIDPPQRRRNNLHAIWWSTLTLSSYLTTFSNILPKYLDRGLELINQKELDRIQNENLAIS